MQATKKLSNSTVGLAFTGFAFSVAGAALLYAINPFRKQVIPSLIIPVPVSGVALRSPCATPDERQMRFRSDPVRSRASLSLSSKLMHHRCATLVYHGHALALAPVLVRPPLMTDQDTAVASCQQGRSARVSLGYSLALF